MVNWAGRFMYPVIFLYRHAFIISVKIFIIGLKGSL